MKLDETKLQEATRKILRLSDIRLSVCSVCGKKFGEVKKCYNVKCTNPFQTEA